MVILFSQVILQQKEAGFLGEMAEPWLGQEIQKMLLEYLAVCLQTVKVRKNEQIRETVTVKKSLKVMTK